MEQLITITKAIHLIYFLELSLSIHREDFDAYDPSSE